MKFFLHLSLRLKLTLLFSILLLVLALFIFIFIPSKRADQLIKAIEDKTAVIGQMTAYSIGPAVFFDDITVVEESFDNAKQNSELLYLTVIKNDGGIYAAYNINSALDVQYKKPGVDFDLGVAKTEIAMYHNNERIGILFIGLSLAKVKEEIFDMRMAIALVSLLVFAVGFIAVLGISTVITKPLHDFVGTIKEIDSGNLNKRVEVSVHDEVGMVAHSFNEMLEKLHFAYDELENLNKTLEKRVLKRTEALLQSEERYKSLYNNTPVMLHSIDNEGRLISVSEFWLKNTGYKREEVIGRKSVDFLTPQSKEYAENVILPEFFRTGFCSDVNYQMVKKNGEIIDISLSATSEKESTGKIIRSLAVLVDVTEKKKAFEQIRKLSVSIEQNPITILITDKDGIIEYVNPKFTAITGYTYEETIGKKTNILKSGHTSQREYAKLWARIKSGKEWRGEFYNKKKNGEFFWESAIISPIKNEHGEITHFVGIKEDITEKKKQEEKLISYQNLLRGVYEAIHHLINEKDFPTAINKLLYVLGVSSKADRVYIFENVKDGTTGELFMSQKYEWARKGITPQINNPDLQNLSYRKSVPTLYECMLHDKSFNVLVKDLTEGERILMEVEDIKSLLVVPIYVDKHFWGFIGFDNCHSEEIWSESEESILKTAAASVGRAIEKERTKDELIKAKEEAEKGERLKSEFLAQMSHEIRSPLNVLLNYAQLFREMIGEELGEEVREELDGMERAGNRIIRTIDLILNLSEIQAGSYDYKPKEIDVYTDILLNLYAEYKKTARKKRLKLNFNSGTGDTKIFCDEYSITQVFANLIDNAIKYTPKGNIDVSVERNEKNKLTVKISDTGIGISEEYFPFLFRPFSQEEQGYTRTFEGNGLGLALVRKYCDMNNVGIGVHSEKGLGTTFTITFNS
ncbi:MAG: PAS domain S-box protein [Ignavibacteriales bacterium]|nr:PAS domain S-box protein [Ignavibacteriales bacterium]